MFSRHLSKRVFSRNLIPSANLASITISRPGYQVESCFFVGTLGHHGITSEIVETLPMTSVLKMEIPNKLAQDLDFFASVRLCRTPGVLEDIHEVEEDYIDYEIASDGEDFCVNQIRHSFYNNGSIME